MKHSEKLKPFVRATTCYVRGSLSLTSTHTEFLKFNWLGVIELKTS